MLRTSSRLPLATTVVPEDLCHALPSLGSVPNPGPAVLEALAVTPGTDSATVIYIDQTTAVDVWPPLHLRSWPGTIAREEP